MSSKQSSTLNCQETAQYKHGLVCKNWGLNNKTVSHIISTLLCRHFTAARLWEARCDSRVCSQKYCGYLHVPNDWISVIFVVSLCRPGSVQLLQLSSVSSKREQCTCTCINSVLLVGLVLQQQTHAMRSRGNLHLYAVIVYRNSVMSPKNLTRDG